jgi:hypothetical protein
MHHVQIHTDLYKYLGFSWEVDGVVQFFFFYNSCLRTQACQVVLSRLLKPVLTFFGLSGVHISVYIDDGMGFASTKGKCDLDYYLSICVLASAGFTIMV